MSNRKRPRNPATLIKEEVVGDKVTMPKGEKVVLKSVPANIKWADVGNIDRDDVEVVGEAIIYEDGTQDVIVFSDISDDAKTLMYGINGSQFSIDKE